MEALTSFNFPNTRHWIASCYTKCLSWYSQGLWGQLAKGELGVSTELRDKRRNKWQQTTRGMVERVFMQAKQNFKEIIELDVWTPDSKDFSGTLKTNLDIYALTTQREKTDISITPYTLGETGKTTFLYERRGDIQICQDNQGIIHIYFYPIELDTEETDKPPRLRLVYGSYEPKNLTEAKLRRAVVRGIRLLLESRTGNKRSIYSWWIYNKNSQFFRGIILSAVLSIPSGWIGNAIAALAGCIWAWIFGGIAAMAYGIWAWGRRG